MNATTSPLEAVLGEIDFDPKVLKTKYLAERDKRVRQDGNEQYVEVEAEFSRYVDDPYVEPGFKREPLNDHVEFAIIGGGFGGLLTAARLKEAGFDDIRVIEKAGDFGGTWYWNRYPGAMCDVEAYCYLPLLEELRYVIKEKNLLYFYSWRPQNVTYLFLFRKHEQGQNAKEIGELRKLVAEKEKEIARLKKPVTHTYELIRVKEKKN